MDARTLKALEYPRIIEILRGKCYSSTGAVYAEKLKPSRDKDEVVRLQKETSEYREIDKYEGGSPLERFMDITAYLDRISMENSFIEGKDILKIGETARVATEVRRFMNSKKEKYPALWRIAGELDNFRELNSEINRILTPDGEVTDNASPKLSRIRNQLETTRSRITEKLERMISSKSIAEYLSDRIITLRDDRYVIPVQDTHKSSVDGIVHDRSSSGATVFMEPLSVLPMNNKLRELRAEEKIEIQRILIGLCDIIRERRDELTVSQQALSKLDFIHARAALSEQYDGTAPEIADESIIKLSVARHPLLMIDSGLPPEKVIPLDFSLGEVGRAFIITGPNTGGKTVALKTVGLSALLVQSGLQVPAKYVKIGIFSEIIADIGDEQSIAMSLSTFSGHMKQISYAVESSGEKSLVLLDELGGGTDPVEGAALGETIIKELIRNGAVVVVTTHLGEFKTLAGEVPEIRNASMEFDREKLIPTYRFMPDIPGSSYAIEVAEKLGMSPIVIYSSRKLIDAGHRSLERLVVQLEENLVRVKKERDELAASRRAASDLEELYQDKLARMKQWEKQSDRLALEKTAEAYDQAQREIENLISDLKKSITDRNTIRKTRRIIQERKQEIGEAIESLKEKPVRKIDSVSPGDKVILAGTSTECEVLSMPDKKGRLKVRAGNVVMEVKITDLAEAPEKAEPVKPRCVRYEEVNEIKTELDLRGLTFEEAEPKLERYLEDVYLAGVYEVRIIHGKGTGALRKKVTEYLKRHRWIEDIRLGNFNEGGAGVTVVKIKS
jgi:DNA mismatch repair protein MutS2